QPISGESIGRHALVDHIIGYNSRFGPGSLVGIGIGNGPDSSGGEPHPKVVPTGKVLPKIIERPAPKGQLLPPENRYAAKIVSAKGRGVCSKVFLINGPDPIV